jgi:hypothetical protein
MSLGQPDLRDRIPTHVADEVAVEVPARRRDRILDERVRVVGCLRRRERDVAGGVRGLLVLEQQDGNPVDDRVPVALRADELVAFARQRRAVPRAREPNVSRGARTGR